VKYLLDTNVVSEVSKPRPSGKVLNFLLANEAVCVIPAVVVAERFAGAFSAPIERQQSLMADVDDFCKNFESKILSFDAKAAKVWGEYVSRQALRERPRSYPDTQIAAIALAHDLIVVTRNTEDFPEVQTLNPFD
jgi:predicted nucleic acid-binding protein